VNIALNHPDLYSALESLRLTCGSGLHPVAALAGVLIHTGKDHATLCSTDFNQRLEIKVPATVNAEGTCLLPLKRLLQAVSSLKDGVAIKSTGAGVQIVSGTTRLKLKEMTSEDFPVPEKMVDPMTIVVDSAILRQLLRVSFCTSADDARPLLRGVCLQSTGTDLMAIGSDGKRLALSAWAEAKDLPKFSVIFPAYTVTTLSKVLPDKGTVTISLWSKHMKVDGAELNYQTDLIEGVFPDWEQIFPATDRVPAVFDRQAMLDALARVAGAHDGKTRGRVELILKPSRIQVRLDGGEEELGEDEVEAEYAGDERRFRFDMEYLAQGLKASGDGKVEFYPAETENRPGLFKSKDYAYVLAPMKTQV
jgi:DNA polymerase-3 subunit beta